MLRGIDISNHQGFKGFTIPNGIEFCIIKATEGNYFVDPYCDGYVQDCIKREIPWGFYHFNSTNNPEEEAQFFYDNCKGYIGKGIPVLDYEVPTYNNAEWAERFISKFHELSNIWPMIYMSQIFPIGIRSFDNSWVPKKCGLWCANYDRDYTDWPNECFIDPYPWEFVAIWQFASDFDINGFPTDADIAFMDETAWGKYAGISTKSEQPGENDNGKTLTGRVTIVLD